MKKKRFSIEQIVAVLKQAELEMPVADLIRQTGILLPSHFMFVEWDAGGHRTAAMYRLNRSAKQNGPDGCGGQLLR